MGDEISSSEATGAALQSRSVMKLLPIQARKRLASSQVITSPLSVIKELVENSIDAQSNTIEVKLDNYGFDKIEVRDNGVGIPKQDTPFMAQRHYTSKITQFSDLEQLTCYGFRGEALSSLCSMAKVHIITKTMEDQLSTSYQLDEEGHVTGQQPSHHPQGTTVVACNLFWNMPVRKRYFGNSKNRKDDLKKIEKLLKGYAIFYPRLRISLSHYTTMIWHKSPVESRSDALRLVFGASTFKKLRNIQYDESNPQVKIDCFLPEPDLTNENIPTRTTNDMFFIFINGRLVVFKEIEKLVREAFFRCCFSSVPREHHSPIAFISIIVPPDTVDINLDSNKMHVLLCDKDDVMEVLKSVLNKIYQDIDATDEIENGGNDTSMTNICYTTDNAEDTKKTQETSNNNCITSIDLAEWSKGKTLRRELGGPATLLLPSPSLTGDQSAVTAPDPSVNYINDSEISEKNLTNPIVTYVDHQDLTTSLESAFLKKSNNLTKSLKEILPLKTKKRKDNKQRTLDELVVREKGSALTDAPCTPVRYKSDEITDIPFTMPSLRKQLMMLQQSQLEINVDFRVIGPSLMQNKNWFFLKENSIQALNLFRIEESLFYRSLKAKHKLPVNSLGVPLELSPFILKDAGLWNTLLSLKKEARSCRHLTDERLIFNGFDIAECTDAVTGKTQLEMVGITTKIPYYGLEDLQELLTAINNNKDCTVSECRPSKVLYYLQGEAVRIGRNLAGNLSRDEVTDILKRVDQEIPQDCHQCFHGKPFFYILKSLNNIKS